MTAIENYNTLNNLSDSKLKDVVKNFKGYNYSIETRNTAIAILQQRGYNDDILNVRGYLDTSNYDIAKSEYDSFKLNYKIGFFIFLLSGGLLCLVSIIMFYLAYRNQVSFYKALGREDHSTFILDMISVLLYFHLRNKMRDELKGIR